MILNDTSIIEFAVGLLLWWVGIYIVSQNPFSKISWLAFGFLGSISLYFSNDFLISAAQASHRFLDIALILKSFDWTIWMPLVFLLHASSLIRGINSKNVLLKYSYIFIYLLAFLLTLIDIFTNFIRDYPKFSQVSFAGDYSQAIGPYFSVMGVFLLLIVIFFLIIFYNFFRNEKKYSANWYKYFLPFIGGISSLLLFPFVLLGYYQVIPHSVLWPSLSIGILLAPTLYSIIRFNLFIDDNKIIFGKEFLYATISVASLLVATLVAVHFFLSNITLLQGRFIIFTLSYLFILFLPFYNWISTFYKDFIFNHSYGLSVVTDEEIAQAIKNINSPARLEDSPLMRLKIVNHHSDLPVDNLRKAVKEAIEYFKPEDTQQDRRLKTTLKYEILRMLAFDQAEEGQILWELGFDEYPVSIMTKETRNRPPRFKVQSPSDYSYVSRNAYLTLKREAIHDIAWRISYLEKLSKKKII